MADRLRTAGLSLAIMAVLASCTATGGAGTETEATTPSLASEPAEPSLTPAPSLAPTPSDSAALDRPWATAELTEVTSGTRFTIADHVAAGKVVFVETMAIWCSNCLAQQRDAVAALDRLDRSKVVWVGLDVDPSERAADLAAYSSQHGFDFAYAIAGQDVARALAADFGDQVLSPPSTPIVVIAPDGRVTLTRFGHKSVDDILALAAEHGA
jgi:thiol-disulfide isomerase/thioredoxin